MDFLIAKVTEDIVTETLEKLTTEITAQVEAYMKEFEYKPRDPPFARRKAMVRVLTPNNETLVKFIVFVMLRGGNPKRAMKNLDEKTHIGITAIMQVLKVKRFSRDGLYSTWQWMTSFWDYTVVLAAKFHKLTDGLFVVGNRVFVPQLPRWAYVTGGLHVFRGVDAKIQTLIKQEVFRHQHFLIFVKNSLDPKKVKNNVDNDVYKANRIVQAGYLDFQMADDQNNFPMSQVEAVHKVLGLNVKKWFDSAPITIDHDWIADPYSADINAFSRTV